MRTLSNSLGILALVCMALGVDASWHGPEQIDRRLNRVALDPTAPAPSAANRAFHESLFS